jgi:hypothetical protein
LSNGQIAQYNENIVTAIAEMVNWGESCRYMNIAVDNAAGVQDFDFRSKNMIRPTPDARIAEARK